MFFFVGVCSHTVLRPSPPSPPFRLSTRAHFHSPLHTPYSLNTPNWHALVVPQTVRNRSMRMALPIHACGARGDTLCEGGGASWRWASTQRLLNWDEWSLARCSCMPTCTPVYILLLIIIIVASTLLGSRRLTRRGWRSRGRRHQQTPGRNSPPSSPTSTPRSLGRTRLPARRVSRWRYPVFQTFGGFGALALLLGDQHLLFVGAAPKGTLTDAEFKTASWGTFDYTALKRGLCVYTPTA